MRDSVEIVLVRHGQTAWNATRRFLGRTDVPLDDVGREQVRALADVAVLRDVDAVYTSPLRRALETAAAFADAATPVLDLAELHQGELEGLDGATAVERHGVFFRRWAQDPTGVCVPGGETLDACRDRAWAVLEGIASAHRGGRVAVVTHQMVIASVSCRAVGDPLSSWRTWAVENAAWRRLRWRDDRVEILEDEILEEAPGGS